MSQVGCMFGWENLKEFEAVRCELSNSKGLVDALADSNKLELMDVSENPFDDHLSIAEYLLNDCQKLETLNLGCTTVGDKVLKAVNQDAIISLKLTSESILHLDLSGIIRDSKLSSSLVEMLCGSQLPNLKALILNKDALSTENFVSLLTSNSLASIEMLSLQNNKIGKARMP